MNETIPTAERLVEVFNQAKTLPAGEQRARFLDEACGDDEQLRAEVDSLLQAGGSAGDYLRAGPAVSSQLEAEFARLKPEEAGDRIGHYKLLEEIGQGGFGTVWMADQEQPVKRRVALKIIKMGMDTKEVIARFEQERQALAMMDHPNIATVLDGGATHLGRPYFVMELVKGMPITEFCDQRQFAPRERLELFAQVCHAVQHAHQKGIIHRDIKPSNVMVSMHDTIPVVKVIDFGIAKALGHELTGRTMFTGFAQLIGTPLYMSPEQAGQSAIDVDTRSDIYSLGVLLYELLTGATPFDRERFSKAAYEEIRRIVREEEPPKPSTRLSESKDSLASVSAQRHMEPAKLTKLVRGDLDWIVMKALEKDRTRRYETANGLASDVQRYLHDEAVVACPPSAAYRLRKFARRNKGPVLAATLLLLALVGGIVGTSFGLVRAEQARRAEARRAEGERIAKHEAEDREAETKAVLDFVENKVFAAARPEGQEGGLGHEVPLRRAIETALPYVEKSFTDRPLIEARLRQTLGLSFFHLGEAAIAAEQFIKARGLYGQHRGPDHPATLQNMHYLADTLRQLGRKRDALKLCEEVVALRRSSLGPDHRDTLASMGSLATSYGELGLRTEGLKLRQEVLALQNTKLGKDDADTLASMVDLSADLYRLGRRDEAVKLCEEVLAMKKANAAPDHRYTLTLMCDLGSYYSRLGKHDAAVRLHEEAVALGKAKLGDNHPETLKSMFRLGYSLLDCDRGAEAIPLFDEFIRRSHEKSIHTGWITSAISRRLQHFEKQNDVAGCRATVEMWERLNRTDHISLYNAGVWRATLARAIRATDQTPQGAAAAEAELDRAMEWLRKAVAAGYAHRAYLDGLRDLMRDREDFQKLLADMEAKADEAIAAAREAARGRPDDSAAKGRLSLLLNKHAWALATAPDPAVRNSARAVELALEAVALFPENADQWNTVGVARYRAGDWKGAIAALQKYRELRNHDEEWTNPFALAMAHWQLDNKVEARRWYDIGVQWMDGAGARRATETMTRFRGEAAELLGVNEKKQPGPSTAPATAESQTLKK